MREILFRGKRIDNGEWAIGYCFKDADGRIFILSDARDFGFADAHQVDPSTVGQYTGLTDKNGKRIFEGDIVEGRDYDAEDGFHENYNGSEFEVIGNIHDNPELLKEETT